MEDRIRSTLRSVFDAEIAAQARLDNLGGHASLRIYWRIHLPLHLDPPGLYPRGESTLMAMVLPEGIDPMKSAEGDGSDLQSQVGSVPELPFVNVHRYLVDIGMPAPSIDHVDMARGVLLLEDLGDRLFEDAVLDAAKGADPDRAVVQLYREAIDLLIRFQRAVIDHQHQENDCLAFERRFDRDLLMWELHHYREWGLETRLDKTLDASISDRLQKAFEVIVDELVDAPQTVALRDYQSRNIMWKKDAWILIDFQDALIGPAVYDLTALLRDSYIELAPHLVEELLDYYIEKGQQADLGWDRSADQMRRLFYLQTVQRKLKDAGRFIYIDRVKKNPSFLDYYDLSIQYVHNALRHLPDLEDLSAVLGEVEPAFGK